MRGNEGRALRANRVPSFGAGTKPRATLSAPKGAAAGAREDGAYASAAFQSVGGGLAELNGSHQKETNG